MEKFTIIFTIIFAEICFSLHFLLFIIQIILLIKSIKGKETKSWIKTFKLEIFSIIFSMILVYFDTHYINKLVSNNLFLIIFHWGRMGITCYSIIVYAIMLFITTCAKIIIYEKQQKQQGKRYIHPFVCIIILILISIPIIFLVAEMMNEWGL